MADRYLYIKRSTLVVQLVLLVMLSIAAGAAIQDWVDSQTPEGAKGCILTYPDGCFKSADKEPAKLTKPATRPVFGA